MGNDPKSERIKELELQVVDLKQANTEKCELIAAAEMAVQKKDAVLEECKSIIMQQERVLRKITSTPNPYATVISKVVPSTENGEHKLVIYSQSQYMEVSVPGKTPEEVKDFFEKVRKGTVLKMAMETMQPFEIVPSHESLGPIVTVRKVLDGYTEIEDGEKGGIRVVLSGDHKMEVGDRVVLDHHGLIVAKNLGKENKRFTVQSDVKVALADIGGYDDVKDMIIDMIEKPFRHPEIYAKYGKGAPKGVLLYGPPGNGKTMFAKAISNLVATIYKGPEIKDEDLVDAFLHMKGPEALSKWVGEAESTIRGVFERARAHKKRTGFPSVIFIDEAESIVGKRGSGVSSDMEKTIVPTFLSEMDGLESSSAIVILATNRPDMLDPAVIREGRIDRKIRIGRPTKEAAANIWRVHLSRKPAAEGNSVESLSELGSVTMHSDERPLYQIERKSGDKTVVTLGHIASGAMIASLVEEATSFAINRDIEQGVFTGITPENIISAVDRMYRDHRFISHKEEIEDLTADWKSDVKGITKVK
jgi:proteasome-associated ATPase